MTPEHLLVLNKQNIRNEISQSVESDTRKLEIIRRAEEFKRYTERQQQILVKFNEYLEKYGSSTKLVHENQIAEYEGVEDMYTSNAYRNGLVPTRASTKINYSEETILHFSESIPVDADSEQGSELIYFGVIYVTHKLSSKTITHLDETVDEPILSDVVTDFGIRYFGVNERSEVSEIINYTSVEVNLNPGRILINGDETLARYPSDIASLNILETEINNLSKS